MRIGKWIGGFFVSTAVNTSGTLFSFLGVIKFILLIICGVLFFAFVAPPIIEVIADYTTPEHIKKLQKDTAEYEARVKAHQERHRIEKEQDQIFLDSLSEDERKQVLLERKLQHAKEYKEWQVEYEAKRNEAAQKFNEEKQKERQMLEEIRK